MSDTKPGDIIRWEHPSYGRLITLVVPDRFTFSGESGPLHSEVKLSFIWAEHEDDPNYYMTKRESFYFTRDQYLHTFHNTPVELLTVRFPC